MIFAYLGEILPLRRYVCVIVGIKGELSGE